FQAEDGIRDFHVTGVQTCALPISSSDNSASTLHDRNSTNVSASNASLVHFPVEVNESFPVNHVTSDADLVLNDLRREHNGSYYRSEESRVGEERRFRCASSH